MSFCKTFHIRQNDEHFDRQHFSILLPAVLVSKGTHLLRAAVPVPGPFRSTEQPPETHSSARKLSTKTCTFWCKFDNQLIKTLFRRGNEEHQKRYEE